MEAKCAVVILTTSSQFTGNACLARRIQSYVTSITPSISCCVLSHEVFSSSKHLQEYCNDHNVIGIIGIHAYRSGRLLIGLQLPYVIVLGGTDVTTFMEDQTAKRIMYKALCNARDIVCFAPWMRDVVRIQLEVASNYFSIAPQAITLVPPASNDEANLHLREKTFVLVAGLRPVKDVDYLVEAMDAWYAEDRSVQLLVVGEQRDEAYVSRIKGQFDASSACSLVAAMSQSKLFCLFQCSRACVNTSLSEGMCGALLEAMALKVPVIARNIVGNAAIVNHEQTGLLFSTPSEFITCAKRVIQDEYFVKGMTTAAAEYVSRVHSVQSECKIYQQVVSHMLRPL
eukprot:gene10228-2385_t